MRKYKLHYGSRFFPSPWKVTYVLCPDGQQRTCLVWCWEGDHSRAEVEIRGEKIQGILNLTKKFYNALLYSENVPDIGIFLPANKSAIKPGKCICGERPAEYFRHIFSCDEWLEKFGNKDLYRTKQA